MIAEVGGRNEGVRMLLEDKVNEGESKRLETWKGS